MIYHYTVQVLIIKEDLKVWHTENRYYYAEKSLTDFDLHDIPEKRKNATLIKKIMNKTF